MSLDIWCRANIDVGNPNLTVVEVGKTFNYTHNVSRMWIESGCYEALYESEGKLVEEILPTLRKALQDMQDNPSKYIPLNPKNKFGTYEGAKKFLVNVIEEFSKYPKANIAISK